MIIELRAENNLNIEDLGIILSQGQSINLLENFNKDDLLRSNDLSPAIDNIECVVFINGETVDYNGLVYRLSSLTEYNHYHLNQLQHNLFQSNFFKVEKQSGNTKFITYYTNSNMTEKIQEDEIIRNNEGQVGEIITKKYSGGEIIQEMHQILNRDTQGKVESITTNTL